MVIAVNFKMYCKSLQQNEGFVKLLFLFELGLGGHSLMGL